MDMLGLTEIGGVVMVNGGKVIGEILNLRIEFTMSSLTEFITSLVKYGMRVNWYADGMTDRKMLAISACDGLGEYRVPFVATTDTFALEMGKFSFYHSDLFTCVEESLAAFGGAGTVYTYGASEITKLVYASGTIVSVSAAGVDAYDQFPEIEIGYDAMVTREVRRMEMDYVLMELYEAMARKQADLVDELTSRLEELTGVSRI